MIICCSDLSALCEFFLARKKLFYGWDEGLFYLLGSVFGV